MKRSAIWVILVAFVIGYIATLDQPFAARARDRDALEGFNWKAVIDAGTDSEIRKSLTSDKVVEEALYENWNRLGLKAIPTLNVLAAEESRDYRQRWVALMASATIWKKNQAKAGALELKKPYYRFLRGMMGDSFSMIRTAAVKAVGKLGDKAFLPDLHTRISDKALIVRHEVVKALAEIGDASSLSALKEEYQARRNFIRNQGLFIRKTILRAIAMIDPKAAHEEVLAALRGDDEPLRKEAMAIAAAIHPTATFANAKAWIGYLEGDGKTARHEGARSAVSKTPYEEGLVE